MDIGIDITISIVIAICVNTDIFTDFAVISASILLTAVVIKTISRAIQI